jgi:FSR family fosmidomycin resistance protein-like MFS transporter
MKAQRRPLLLLSGLILFRSTSIQSIATFYPTYLTDRGSDIMYAGFALSMYELAGAGGALFGGTLSDRFGRKTMMLVSQALAGPLLWIALGQPDGTAGIVVLAVAGALALSASPVQLTLAQELLPGSRSTAAGIVFFLGFEGTLVSTLFVGVIADVIGLGPALSVAVIASMLSIPFTLALPETSRRG